HLLRDYGGVLTYAYSEDVEEFLDAVIKQQNFVIGRERNLMEKSLMGALIAPRYLPFLIPSIAIHYEQNVPRIKKFFLKKTGRWKNEP
ncbi:MAG TPA: histidinol phosphatase, partial [Methanoregulaceae archaeon]|nr:histidinol phosphatase [Methanoregulaceae archaeon]